MSHHQPNPVDRFLTRREMLSRCGMGMGALALDEPARPLRDAAGGGPCRVGKPRQPGPGHRVPQSATPQGTPVPRQGQARHPPVHERRPVAGGHVRPQAVAGEVRPASRCRCRRCGPSARPARRSRRRTSSQSTARAASRSASCSSTSPQCVDDMCVIRSMHADVPNHEPSLLLMNCGESRQIRPSLGSWVTYGLGTENQNLPGFVVMCPGGYPDPGVAELAERLPARRATRGPTSTASTPTSKS